MRADDPGQPFSEQFLHFYNGSGRDDFPAVVVVAFPRDVPLFVFEDLLFDFIEARGNRRIHVRGDFLSVIKVATRFDIRFGNMTLMLFHREDEMYFQHFIANSA